VSRGTGGAGCGAKGGSGVQPPRPSTLNLNEFKPEHCAPATHPVVGSQQEVQQLAHGPGDGRAQQHEHAHEGDEAGADLRRT